LSKRISLVAFVAAVVVQLLILVAVPARKVVTLTTGKTVFLKVQPVDPYNLLSGYYNTLSFDIADPNAFPNAQVFPNGAWVYAIVQRGDDGIWTPALLVPDLPASVAENRAALLGQIKYGRIKYGIEEFYIPEAQRYAVGEDLRNNIDKARVEVKVDSSGHAALVRLQIENRTYE
jgi:uncharacterized membrane-anchored protein